jgi:2-hydroxychromene-2-carboxylate isomerase
MAEKQIDFWFTMGSTYTYLTAMRLPEIARTTTRTSAGDRFISSSC